MSNSTESLEQSLNIQRDVCLQPFNTMAVAAKAKFLVTISDAQQLKLALSWADERQLSIVVLGEGSNTLFRSDYTGLVILNRIKGIELIDESQNWVLLKIGSGENWHELVEHSVARSWCGLENLALIPGLVGAAPIQNIGAYGVEISDYVHSVEYVDIESKRRHRLSNQKCEFAYRDSIFKGSLFDQAVIISVSLKLAKKAQLNLTYPALQTYLKEADIKSPAQADVFNAVCDIRSSKLPSPEDIPNVGSFFKNPLVTAAELAKLKQQYPNLVSFKTQGGYKLAAAWLIENAGWKQQELDGVRVHQDHALVIVNPKRKNGLAIVNLAQRIQSDIKAKYKVVLEIEPRVI